MLNLKYQKLDNKPTLKNFFAKELHRFFFIFQPLTLLIALYKVDRSYASAK